MDFYHKNMYLMESFRFILYFFRFSINKLFISCFNHKFVT